MLAAPARVAVSDSDSQPGLRALGHDVTWQVLPRAGGRVVLFSGYRLSARA
jgi:hypothetical protein